MRSAVSARAMTRLPRVLPLAALAGVLAIAVTASAAPARSLPFAQLDRLSRATSLGRASSSTPMRIGAALQRPDAAGEDAYVRALYDPSSPSYHRFLSPSAFRAQFGVTSAARAATRRWLTAGGLRVDYAAPDYLLATGTVAQVE